MAFHSYGHSVEDVYFHNTNSDGGLLTSLVVQKEVEIVYTHILVYVMPSFFRSSILLNVINPYRLSDRQADTGYHLPLYLYYVKGTVFPALHASPNGKKGIEWIYLAP